MFIDPLLRLSLNGIIRGEKEVNNRLPKHRLQSPILSNEVVIQATVLDGCPMFEN